MNNYMQPNGSSLYGNYRTRTFADIFESEEQSSALQFATEWEESPFYRAFAGVYEPDNLDIEFIFYLLYARYGNSTIASSDENRFKYQLFSIIFQYGPAWKKELTIQHEILSLTAADFQKGSTNIVNNAYNPNTAPTTQTTEELLYINQQNVSKTNRSLADGYALMLSLIKEDVTEAFLKRFQKLFITIVEPERPLWYATYPEEE